MFIRNRITDIFFQFGYLIISDTVSKFHNTFGIKCNFLIDAKFWLLLHFSCIKVETARALAVRRVLPQVYTSNLEPLRGAPPHAFAQVNKFSLYINLASPLYPLNFEIFQIIWICELVTDKGPSINYVRRFFDTHLLLVRCRENLLDPLPL